MAGAAYCSSNVLHFADRISYHPGITMHETLAPWGIQLVVAGVQLGNSLFLTALPIVVKERCINASSSSTSNSTLMEDSWQTAVSSFYITYKVVSQMVSIIPGLCLAWLGDKGWRRALIVVPLMGFVLSRLTMLLMLTLDWPLEVLWVEVTITALCGGINVFWSGTMTLLSLSSSDQDRSKIMMRTELTSGIAGLVGCMASGHLFDVTSGSLRPGVLTMVVSLILFGFCIFYILCILQTLVVGEAGRLNKEASRLSYPVGLRWQFKGTDGPTLQGTDFYTNQRMMGDQYISDTKRQTRQTSPSHPCDGLSCILFFSARILTLFSLMPTPLIRSLMSQQVHSSSYGIVLTSLQLSLKVSSAGFNLLYSKVYQQTLHWFPGFVFLFSSIITITAIIPIRCVQTHRRG
ncbi:solute carrier family 46 member 2-like [Aulostomus maculatus]